MKAKALFLCITMLAVAAPLLAQAARGTAEATVNGKKLTLDYGRPSLKGRDLSAFPVGSVWRLGSNKATSLTTDGELNVGGTTLAAGKYSLWTKKTGENEWKLLFHAKGDMWGAPAPKDGFVAEMPLKFEKTSDSAEELAIALADKGGKANIAVHWGTLRLSGDFGVK